jgi:hypothetical protein
VQEEHSCIEERLSCAEEEHSSAQEGRSCGQEERSCAQECLSSVQESPSCARECFSCGRECSGIVHPELKIAPPAVSFSKLNAGHGNSGLEVVISGSKRVMPGFMNASPD